MRKILTSLLLSAVALCAAAQEYEPVKLTVVNKQSTFTNGLMRVRISNQARVELIHPFDSKVNMMASNGIYFDYTAESNTALKPDEMEVIRQDDDYAEVVYRNTTGDLHISQGFIMRRGVSGFYTYVIMEGTANPVSVREARVCCRMNANYLNGYVDDRMQGEIPNNSVMSSVESSSSDIIQDATYRLPDGTIYTKYNWANYVVNDSVHGLMNNNYGLWNIACSHEWLNGGPMRQELTVHATGKSPITIQMLQGEHFGASAMTLAEGQKIMYGPMFVYVNTGTKEEMIADAKRMAHEQMAQWPFRWFNNEEYPLERSVATGRLYMSNGSSLEGMQVVLAAPGGEVYRQTGGYIYWGKTDANGDFAIKNIRPGEYTLYAYATQGDVVEEFEVDHITIGAGLNELGSLYWYPTTLEDKLWQIGENNRKSDLFKMSDDLRAYGLFNEPPANLNFTIGESSEADDWYYAQTKNGSWNITFNVDKAYEGDALLSASVAGATNNPKIAVVLNGVTKGNWSFYNDAAIYRSAVLGGRHCVRTLTFPASELKQGSNTLTLKMTGISKNGGVMWDCLKLEAGKPVEAGIDAVITDETSGSVTLYTTSGVKAGTYATLDEARQAPLAPGIYIYRGTSAAGKLVK
ncbi:MAG: polysaccharide lyase family protein [Lachnoclostridium sp.]|nr:polysaccharide lyase family protein [Lachnoclostridium sp.]